MKLKMKIKTAKKAARHVKKAAKKAVKKAKPKQAMRKPKAVKKKPAKAVKKAMPRHVKKAAKKAVKKAKPKQAKRQKPASSIIEIRQEQRTPVRQSEIIREDVPTAHATPKTHTSEELAEAEAALMHERRSKHRPHYLRVEEESDESIKTCPECNSPNLIRDYERGEIICRNCALVITDALTDYGPEWRAFDSEQKDKRARTGGPTKLMRPNKGLVTEIDQYNKDIRGAKIDTRMQAQLHRMRKWHKRISIASSFEKNLAIALGELDRVASSLGLPDNIKENIAALYRKAVKSELIRGRLIESVVAAVIYAACRIYGIPRTLDEISKISGVEKKEIGRAYRFLKRELELDIPLTDPSAYVPKFAVVLNLSRDVQMAAIDIIKKSLKKGLISGRGPTGVAAAALYIAAAMKNEKRTQKEVADVAGVTEVTIRNRYRELKKELDIDINL